MLLNGHDTRLLNKITHAIFDKNNTTKDGSYDYINIDAYQQGQLLDKICANTSVNHINPLNITYQLQWVEEYLIKHWKEST